MPKARKTHVHNGTDETNVKPTPVTLGRKSDEKKIIPVGTSEASPASHLLEIASPDLRRAGPRSCCATRHGHNLRGRTVYVRICGPSKWGAFFDDMTRSAQRCAVFFPLSQQCEGVPSGSTPKNAAHLAPLVVSLHVPGGSEDPIQVRRPQIEIRVENLVHEFGVRAVFGALHHELVSQCPGYRTAAVRNSSLLLREPPRLRRRKGRAWILCSPAHPRSLRDCFGPSAHRFHFQVRGPADRRPLRARRPWHAARVSKGLSAVLAPKRQSGSALNLMVRADWRGSIPPSRDPRRGFGFFLGAIPAT
eukprot:scaffold434_cov186-Pinguiococcus_pyrenoidosus.AAC.115